MRIRLQALPDLTSHTTPELGELARLPYFSGAGTHHGLAAARLLPAAAMARAANGLGGEHRVTNVYGGECCGRHHDRPGVEAMKALTMGIATALTASVAAWTMAF